MAGKGHEQARGSLDVAVVRHVRSDGSLRQKRPVDRQVGNGVATEELSQSARSSKDLRFQQAAYWFVPAVPTRMSYETA